MDFKNFALRDDIVLTGDRICLKMATSADISEEYIDGLNDPAVNRFLVEVKNRRQTRESVAVFIEENRLDPLSILFSINISQDQSPFIGTVRLYGISEYHWCATVGICIFRKASWGQGYGTEALNLVRGFAFNEMGLHYLEAGVYPENAGSLAIFKKSGFVDSYHIRQKYRYDNRFVDVVMLGAVNPSFDIKKLSCEMQDGH